MQLIAALWFVGILGLVEPFRGKRPQKSFQYSSLSSSQSSSRGILDQIDNLYETCSGIKCPFFRRRAIDLVENIQLTLNFIVARHKSIPFIDLSKYLINIEVSDSVKSNHNKTINLPIKDVAEIIYNDWSIEKGAKGYYITGKLTKSIYDEDCLFSGPDPDMPVRGLKKYLLFASQLFHRQKSKAELRHPLVINKDQNTITAYWRIEGVLNLPWKPLMKPFNGITTYKMNHQNLIVAHHEEWEISFLDALLFVLIPVVWNKFGVAPARDVNEEEKIMIIDKKYIELSSEVMITR